MTTAVEIITTVRKLAAEYPDAVYGSIDECAYETGTVTNGPPGVEGCIFGQAGLVLGILDRFPTQDAGGIGIATVFADYLEAPIQGDEQDWMEKVQGSQDKSMSWGKAVEAADSVIGLIHKG